MWARRLLVEEPEESALVVVQIVDQVVRVPRTNGVRVRARTGVASGVVSQQRGPAEHQQRRFVHEHNHGQQAENLIESLIIAPLILLQSSISTIFFFFF